MLHWPFFDRIGVHVSFDVRERGAGEVAKRPSSLVTYCLLYLLVALNRKGVV